MKKIYIIILSAMCLSSCTPQPFTGRIVDKEYIAGHRCHTEGYVQVQEANVVPFVPKPAPHHHTWQHAQVTLWVANRDQVRAFSVDTLSFEKWVVGSKVTF